MIFLSFLAASPSEGPTTVPLSTANTSSRKLLTNSGYCTAFCRKFRLNTRMPWFLVFRMMSRIRCTILLAMRSLRYALLCLSKFDRVLIVLLMRCSSSVASTVAKWGINGLISSRNLNLNQCLLLVIVADVSNSVDDVLEDLLVIVSLGADCGSDSADHTIFNEVLEELDAVLS